jgi:hypothetical protein
MKSLGPNLKMRTEEVEGEALWPPTVGKSFSITADPLEAGDVRLVSTSPVAAVAQPSPNQCRITTRSGSTYLVTRLA